MRLFMIFIALVIALAAGVGFWLVSSSPEPRDTVVAAPEATPVAPVQEQTILIARQNIPVGKVMDANDIDRQVWPAHLVHPDFVADGREGEVVDRVSRVEFKQGQPLVMSFLANKNDPGFLAAQLPAGMRAVTIAVDAISGINGLIFPGDRVDVLVKHNITLEQDFKSQAEASSPTGEGEPKGKATTVQMLPRESSYKVPLLMSPSKSNDRPVLDITEVLVPNARILAIGKASTQYEGTESAPTNVTLEVSELHAQMIRHADEGSLTLSLRSIEDADKQAMPRPVADADMTSLTPPAYFPFLYSKGDYKTEVMELEEIDYEAAPEGQQPGGKKDQIVIIRGVKKETVGVDRP